MICNNCKAEIEADCEFCPECGIPVTAESTKPKPSKKRRLIIIGAAGVVLIVAVVMLILILSGAFKKYKLSDETKAEINNPYIVQMMEDYLNDWDEAINKAEREGNTINDHITPAIKLFDEYYNNNIFKDGNGSTDRLSTIATIMYIPIIYEMMDEMDGYTTLHNDYIKQQRELMDMIKESYCK